MAYLGKYIRQILSRKEAVIFPGFGSLVLKEGKGVPGDGPGIDPPGVMIKFDATHPKDDGKLAKEYAEGEKLELEEANQQVLELVDAIKFKLDKGEKYKLDIVGEFSRDDDNKIHFVKDYNWVLDPELFGLATLDLLELDAEDTSSQSAVVSSQSASKEGKDEKSSSVKAGESKPSAGKASESKPSYAKVTDDKPKPRVNRAPVNKWRIIWIVVGSLFVVLVAILLIPSGNGGVEFGREGIVFKDSSQSDTHAAGQPDGVIPGGQGEESSEQWAVGSGDASEEVKQQLEDEPVQSENQPVVQEPEDMYFIIAGSFKSIINAREMQEELIAKGFDSQIIATEGNLYRVAVEGYTEKQDAVNALPAIRRETGLDGAWVFSR